MGDLGYVTLLAVRLLVCYAVSECKLIVCLKLRAAASLRMQKAHLQVKNTGP